MNKILSTLWLALWRLLPANPILVRVVAGGSRRVRHLWLRAGYLVILLAVVGFALLQNMGGVGASLTDLAKGASRTFMYASYAQLLLMCFLAPVFTASAITQEKDAQTFNILISTPLSNAQIVLGSLMSRLYFVIMLLLAGLPIFLITMVYGGVTTRQVLESFALAGSTAILTGALAIFVAMIGVGTRRTIFSFYLLIALYLLTVYLFGSWSTTWIAESAANIEGVRMSWLTPLHPFLALDVALNRVYAPEYTRLGSYGSIARYALAYPSAAYVAWTLSVAVVLVAISVLFVRRGVKTGETTWLTSLAARFVPGKVGERTREPRHVWANPVAWREASTKAIGGGLLRWIIILGGLGAGIMVFVGYTGGTMQAMEVRKWLAAITLVQFSAALLIATNTAATSITKERESLTMDLLLTTPLTSKYILWGKLRGLVSFAMPLLIGPMVTLMGFAIYDWVKGNSPPVAWIETAFALGAVLILFTAVGCVIGLNHSIKRKTNMAAVMWSMGVTILGAGLVSMVGAALVEAVDAGPAAFVAPFTPVTSILYLIDPAALFDHSSKEFIAGSRAARTSAAAGSAFAVVLYALLVWRTYTTLVRDFDMTIRKQSA